MEHSDKKVLETILQTIESDRFIKTHTFCYSSKHHTSNVVVHNSEYIWKHVAGHAPMCTVRIVEEHQATISRDVCVMLAAQCISNPQNWDIDLQHTVQLIGHTQIHRASRKLQQNTHIHTYTYTHSLDSCNAQ